MWKDGIDGRDSDFVLVTFRPAVACARGVCVTVGPPKTASSPEKVLVLLSPSVSLREARRSIERRFEGGGDAYDSSTDARWSK